MKWGKWTVPGIVLICALLATLALLPGIGAHHRTHLTGSHVHRYSVLAPHAELYLLSLATRSTVRVSLPAGAPADAEHPVWSPDGRRLAFTGRACGSCVPSLYLLTLRTGSLRRLAAGFDPSWSRQGELVFSRSQANGTTSIGLIADNRLRPRALFGKSSSLDAEQPNWSPDGARIAFVSEQYERTQILEASTEGGTLKVLTHDPLSVSQPSWSPDGRYIAFCKLLPDARWRIYVMNPDGTGVHPVTHGPGDDISPTWSPDSVRIAFASDRGNPTGYHSLYVVRPGGPITRLTASDGDDTSPAWSPDGKRIVFSHRSAHWITDPCGRRCP